MMITLFMHCLYQWPGIIIRWIIGMLIYHVPISCQHQAQAEGIFSEEMEQREADSSSLWSRVDVFLATIALPWGWTWTSIISNKMVVMSCSNFHLWVSLAPRLPVPMPGLGFWGRFLGCFWCVSDSQPSLAYFLTVSPYFHGENDHQPFIKSRFWGCPIDFQEPNPFPSLSRQKKGSQISWCPIVACLVHEHICTCFVIYIYGYL